jgi:D-tyrosyl-tRNA(Tyr) deacylase
MRAVIQRVSSAAVDVDGRTVSEIEKGLLVLIGLHPEDTEKDRDYITSKIINLRIFNDTSGTMNLSLKDTGGEVLLVSQFTLLGNAHKGNRPSYAGAMPPDKAAHFFSDFIDDFKIKFPGVKTGIFGADMKVRLTNDGPVTILIDSKKVF